MASGLPNGDEHTPRRRLLAETPGGSGDPHASAVVQLYLSLAVDCGEQAIAAPAEVEMIPHAVQLHATI